jgi:hypothetical protein
LLTEKCFPEAFAVGQIRRRKCLKSFSVADSNEVLFANVWNDRNVGGKVEINWQQNERGRIFSVSTYSMKNEDYCII